MFSNMKPAEKRLLEACQKGEFLFLEEKRPMEKTDKNEIRGEFLRALILSNNQEIEENGKKYILKVDAKGVMFCGVFVSGEFNFSFCSTDLLFLFVNSIFEKKINISDSKIKFLNLQGTKVLSIDGQRLVCESQVFLRDGFESRGEVNFHSAQISGDLDCSNGKFYNENGNALNCEKSKIDGSISFNNGFEAKGNINLSLSQIYYNLDCSYGKFYNKNKYVFLCNNTKINGSVFFRKSEFYGEINFISAQIGSNFECINSKFNNEKLFSINCNKALINGSFYLWVVDIKGNINFDSLNIANTLNIIELDITGNLMLNSSIIKEIIINDNFWEKENLKELFLDGLEYKHLSGNDLNSFTFISLFKKMSEFKPQPYKQLAKVLRNMGHHEDANNIMIEYNDIITSKSKNWFIKILKKIYGFTAGYGYKPLRVLGTMFIVWLFCSLFYWNASKVAVFAPTNPLVFQKKDSYICNVNSNGTPLLDFFNYSKYNSSNNWILNENLEGEYTTFNPFLYSLDVILPIVDLEVEKDWGQYVSSNNGTLNDFTRWLMWFEILFGWTYSLILVAILSGLAKNEKD
ncbi:hypothetical protein AB0W31_02085 [Aliarcobacter butzleri]|uniref:hypothetical protein n=2 Tax=Aliarcobacter butzleri TaxID=28197 RepID=UPI003450C0BF